MDELGNLLRIEALCQGLMHDKQRQQEKQQCEFFVFFL